MTRVCGARTGSIDSFFDQIKAECLVGDVAVASASERARIIVHQPSGFTAKNGFEDHLVKSPSGDAYVSTIPEWELVGPGLGNSIILSLPGRGQGSFKGLRCVTKNCDTSIQIEAPATTSFNAAKVRSVTAALTACGVKTLTEQSRKTIASQVSILQQPVVFCDNQFVEVNCNVQVNGYRLALVRRAPIEDSPQNHPFVSKFVYDVDKVKKHGTLCKPPSVEVIKASLDECYIIISSVINYL